MLNDVEHVFNISKMIWHILRSYGSWTNIQESKLVEIEIMEKGNLATTEKILEALIDLQTL